MDTAQLFNYLHSARPEQLAALLRELLAQVDARPQPELPATAGRQPVEALHALSIVVPELAFVLTRLALAQDQAGALALAEALETALVDLDLQPDSPYFPGAALEPAASRQLAWLLGRLSSMLTFVRRIPLMAVPAGLQEELQDGGRSRNLLKHLADQGPCTLRALAQAKVLDATSESPERVRQVLTPLVRAGIVESISRQGRNEYRLTPVGIRILEVRPVWLDAVERGYRAYRLGQKGLPVPFFRSLEEIFAGVDAESASTP